MMAFVCLFCPALLTAFLSEKLQKSDSRTFASRLFRFVCSFAFINFVTLAAMKLFADAPENLFTQIREFGGVSLKYLLLASLLALALPFVHGFFTGKLRNEGSLSVNAVLTIYGVVLIALNVIRIFDNNFWGDEAFTIMLSKMSIPEMLQITASDVHPPLYYLQLIAMYRLFGAHGWVFHLGSILPYLVLVLLGLTLLKKNFGAAASALFLTFISLSYTSVTVNVEARMYALASMFVFIAFWGCYQIIKKERFAALTFVLASLGAAYTHYYALISVAILYAALILFLIAKRITAKSFLFIYGTTIIGYLPWLFQMLKTFERTSKDFWITDYPSFKEGLAYFFRSSMSLYTYGMLLLTIALVAAAVIKDFHVIRLSRSADKKIRVALSAPEKAYAISDDSIWMSLGILMSLGTLAAGELICMLIRPAFLPRYLYPVLPALWLVLCVGLSKIKFRNSCTIIILVLTLVMYFPLYLTTYGTEKAEDAQCAQTQSAMRELLGEEDVLLTDGSHLGWTILPYYLPDNPYLLVDNDFNEWDKEKNYWLVWTRELNDADSAWLEEAGYSAGEIIPDGLLGCNTFRLYKLTCDVDE